MFFTRNKKINVPIAKKIRERWLLGGKLVNPRKRFTSEELLPLVKN